MTAWALPALGLLVLAANVAQAALHPAAFANLNQEVVLGLLGAVPYAVAVWFVLRRMPPRGSLAVVLAVAALMRVGPLTWTPFLSTDLYRYIWDGRVQLAGINPYRYIPADPALAALRDPSVFTMINRADYAPTIYPPAAQALFAAVAAVAQTPLAIRAVMIGLEAAAVLVMLRLLTLAGLRRERILLYAWQPAWPWEFAGSGHVDVAAMLFVGLALLATARHRRGWAGAALAGAFMVKFVPAVIAPALWRGRGWRMPVVAVATVAAGYALYSSAGLKAFGFLGGYADEEGISGGTGLLAVHLARLVLPLPSWAGLAWLAAVAMLLAFLASRIILPPHGEVAGEPATRVRRHATDAMLLATVTSVALTPHYTWYFAWLAYLTCLVPWRSVLWLTVACLILYAHPFATDFQRSLPIYLPMILLAWWDARRPLDT